MKKHILSIFALIGFATSIQAQNKVVSIHGKFLNYKLKYLLVMPIADPKGFKEDTIHIHKDGSFAYQTTSIKQPITVWIANPGEISISVFLAPGYNLAITADLKDYETLNNTTTFSGVGSKTNRYWLEVNHASKDSHPDTIKWYKKTEDEFMLHMLMVQHNLSIVELIKKNVFGADNKEPFKAYFENMVTNDTLFYPMLIGFYYASMNNYTPAQTGTLLKKWVDHKILENISEDRWLGSALYSYLITSRYWGWQLERDFATNPELNRPFYAAEKITNLFKGRTQEYVLFTYLKGKISSIVKEDELGRSKLFIGKITDPFFKKELMKIYSMRKTVVEKIAFGKDAPFFKLPDTSNVMHSITDFKGKVLYMDLWASWCGPCKEELPYMKNIYEKYKRDSNIVIISIAVKDNDYRAARFNIIKKEQINWLQLEDKKDVVFRNYRADAIPRFVIINKHGKIVNFDAPRPSNKDELINLLNNEIEKN